MKWIVILILIGGAAYFYRQHTDDLHNPEVISKPVYAEIRLGTKVGPRDLEVALFAEMADAEDCHERTQKVWDKVIEGCKLCSIQKRECLTELDSRYQRLFENRAIHSTYLTFNRGSRFERNGRMVLFGLTADEGDQACSLMRDQFRNNYHGQVECVIARRD